jgi:hypothetical protein
MLPAALAEAKKAIAAAVAGAAVIASTGALNGTAEIVVNAVLASAGAVVVWLVRNDTVTKMIADEQGLEDALDPIVEVIHDIAPVVPYPDDPAAPTATPLP